VGEAKACAFCGFTSSDAAAFSAHMTQAHAWDQVNRPHSSDRRRPLAGLAGSVLAGGLAWQIATAVNESCVASTGSAECAQVWLAAIVVVLLPALVVGFVAGIVVFSLIQRRARDVS
jgi:hypothetical protein